MSAIQGQAFDPREVLVPGEDPVLAALHQAEASYQEVRDRWEAERAELLETRAQLAQLAGANRQLTSDLEASQGQLNRERQRAERQRQRARQMADALKSIHRALFDGN